MFHRTDFDMSVHKIEPQVLGPQQRPPHHPCRGQHAEASGHHRGVIDRLPKSGAAWRNTRTYHTYTLTHARVRARTHARTRAHTHARAYLKWETFPPDHPRGGNWVCDRHRWSLALLPREAAL